VLLSVPVGALAVDPVSLDDALPIARRSRRRSWARARTQRWIRPAAYRSRCGCKYQPHCRGGRQYWWRQRVRSCSPLNHQPETGDCELLELADQTVNRGGVNGDNAYGLGECYQRANDSSHDTRARKARESVAGTRSNRLLVVIVVATGVVAVGPPGVFASFAMSVLSM